MEQKILVVGAGLSGVTVARNLAENGFLVDVVDKRNHIAGNAFDYVDENGFRIHKFGPHLFHTNDHVVVDWLSRFTEWIPYKHKVKALLRDGSYVTLPPNKETRLTLGEQGIVDILIRPYTKKMWTLELEDVDPKVIARIPFRNDDNQYYFPNDAFQALPKDGYTSMVARMLDHANININLSTSFEKGAEENYIHTFNSMPIDEYFNFCYGALPYRSIKFTHITFPASTLFPAAVTNFTHNGPHTRVTEWRHLPGHGNHDHLTALTYEEPCDYIDNRYERYYPVRDISGKNRLLYMKYRELVESSMTFIGRCGQYKYLDMHQAVRSSISVARRHMVRYGK